MCIVQRGEGGNAPRLVRTVTGGHSPGGQLALGLLDIGRRSTGHSPAGHFGVGVG